jgi:hypothetical protein
VLTVVVDSLKQFIAIFGVFVVAGLAMTLLSRWTGNALRQFLWPSFGTYVFGFIGVPWHEFCHAFFCKVFGHEIKQVKWFDAKAKGGAHGAVTHLYHPWNPYHRLGHFFIGLGPVLLSPLLLAALLYMLVPTARPLFYQNVGSLQEIGAFLKSCGLHIFNRGVFTSWGIYVFLYLAACVSSQVELSREDLSQAARGLVPVIGLLLLINGVAFGLGSSVHATLMMAGWKLATLSGAVYLLAMLIAGFNLVLWTLVLSFINRISGQNAINPFELGR